ncbi:chemotaxis protein CheW [Ornithinibacillus scapharcae]|uniref:chemotaxis protein CheW n=1 Tax=Ornithinibacillus scapharcae TaxID=1147159 RepID=UPI000225AAF9|nr:chemotaxis protein CheW [Ornithinibacillus scapharcae]
MGIMKTIIFRLNEQSFGIDVQQILSIERVQAITPIPKAPVFIKGLINLRDANIPIIDLKERLMMAQSNHSSDNRILIVSLNDRQVGFMVDAATDVVDIDDTMIELAPSFTGQIDNSFIQGVAKIEENLLILLDLENILNMQETKVVENLTN